MQTQTLQRPKKFSSFRNFLQPAIGLFIIYFIFRYFDSDKIFHYVQTINREQFIKAVVCLLLIIPLASLRLKFHSASFGYQKEFSTCVKSVFAGLSINMIVPAKAGDFAKSGFLREENDSWKDLIGICFLERVFDIFCLGLIGLSAAAILEFNILSYASVLMIIAASLIFFIILWNSKLIEKLKFVSFEKIVGNFKSDVRVIFKPLAFSFLCSLNNALFLGFLFKSIELSTEILKPIAVLPIATLASAIPITPMGFGTRDGAFLFFLSDFIMPEKILAASLLYILLSQVTLGTIGLFVFFKKETVFKKNHH